MECTLVSIRLSHQLIAKLEVILNSIHQNMRRKDLQQAFSVVFMEVLSGVCEAAKTPRTSSHSTRSTGSLYYTKTRSLTYESIKYKQ